MNHIKDTIIHKEYMMRSALKMSEILIAEQKEELAMELLKRAAYHDNSKFDKDEAVSLSSIQCKKALIDPNINLSDEERKTIEQHWKKNRHHPEHFDDIEKMKEIDILEMVCDWHARSEQHKTNLIDFVLIRQENRFHFPEDMFEKILKYCKWMVK